MMTVPVPSSTVAAAATAARIAHSSITSIVTSVPTAVPNAMESQDPNQNGECELLGPFSLVVQAALGALALLSLVYKRWKERPQRPVKVWAFDVSKQVFGSAMLHLANLLMSMFSAGHFEITRTSYQPNPCSFYLLNLGIDTTLGIPILVFILRIVNHLAQYTPLANPPESIESGNYGHPPKTTWWFKQSLLYFIGLLWMKICVFFIIQMFPVIVKIGDWALRWTEGNTATQIIFVMLLFPVIMNAIQYYIIDTFIKKQVPVDREPLLDEDALADAMLDDDRHRRSALLAAISDDEDSESDDEAMGKPVHFSSQMNVAAHSQDSIDYDPTTDGEDADRASSSNNYRLDHAHHERNGR
ncbi:hypothetical protein T310_3594 [Rasamsonia emersonii CBS 393.64]|uniref:Vacuolar membrane protein n=1 Tax=Rasamsonia emersonii (strain ATCC 16479 / CBS 393.64 / IMI 116815) TaxID=1408163 RepID=A0A0F4YXP5_RASE3|nr:hypothetical protein T310_3594 [Rasamsonia emersonii CBS 393.64]KKA22388.1 hypothetical protein T310_3594 [Rasamsonia emersonii CBS 393.64]